MTTTTHQHRPYTEDGDVCVECGELFCPDTLTTVDYDSDTDRYWHRDGSTCFLHRRANALDPELGDPDRCQFCGERFTPRSEVGEFYDPSNASGGHRVGHADCGLGAAWEVA